MENLLLFNAKGFSDYVYWQEKNKKITQRINELIKSIQRNGALEGIGKPEVLRGSKGCYSRRIDEKNRLIYTFIEDNENRKTLITACRDHYSDGVSREKKNLLQGLHI
jgi:toxin YoeB